MPAYCLLPLPQRAILRHVKRVRWLKAVLMMLMLLVFSEVNAHVRLERPEVRPNDLFTGIPITNLQLSIQNVISLY